jgi:hypothetical protein
MKCGQHILSWFLILLLLCWSMSAQQTSSPVGSATVPRLVHFSGKATDAQGKVIVGMVGATFAIYKEEHGGSPLWLETQNVQGDVKGNYTVQLGATKPDGLPQDLFSSGEARWLGVTVNGGQEQPRVLLLSVPYALKAADAETIGGLPPSAFVLVAPANGGGDTTANNSRANNHSSSASGAPPASSNVTTTGGTVNAVPLWTTPTNVQSSAISQTGTGTTAKIGIGTTTPAVTLDVKGAETVRGALTLPANGTATASKGANSQPADLVASSFSSSTSTAVNQRFRWQAEPAANNTANPSGTLNLLYGLGATPPSETGLQVSSTGLITFSAGQTFPGAGTGTITGITTASGSGLAGGGTSGTLNLRVPAAGVTNSMLQNSKITLNATTGGGLTAPGAMTLGGTSQIGLQTCGANQVLQYISGAWTCSALATGTVTSVALSAPLSDFAVSGSPVTRAGTLGLTWNVSPDFNNTPNAIVKRDGTGSFAAGNITSVTMAAANPAGIAIIGSTAAPAGAVVGINSGSSAVADGVDGVTSSAAASGVAGINNSGGIGVYATGGTGVYGTGAVYGVQGQGNAQFSEGGNFVGFTAPADSAELGGPGIAGYGGNGGTNGPTQGGIAVYGQGGSGTRGDGAGGYFVGGCCSSLGDGIDAFNGSGYAGNFSGDVHVSGNLSKGGGSFKIDHPLDPANKYLYHSFVESPDMMNVYNGTVALDADGGAVIQMPEWFGVLNRDFRYQLTCIGGFAPIYIAEELANNQFKIGGGRAGLKVSWQVTGIRQDAWANAHRIPVEEEKNARERGFYIHPELYGAPPEKQIEWARHPQVMKRMRERQASITAKMGSPVRK